MCLQTSNAAMRVLVNMYVLHAVRVQCMVTNIHAEGSAILSYSTTSKI